ncbi:MAG: hypothetical protein A2X80_10285 [Geobacteraceae bacterium GWB2_52_12]|nr:MAG: hypothetical protein A2X80_10285 [Geobacteraceae bacterium GWB2_52_12]
MIRNIINLKAWSAVALVLSMTGCGGGDSTSVSATTQGDAVVTTYAGNTSLAVVTASNAKSLSLDAYQGVQTFSSAAAVGKAANDSQPSPPRLQELSKTLEIGIQTAVTKSTSTAKVAAATVAETINGASGNYSYTIEVNQATGAFSGTLVFSEYRAYTNSVLISGGVDCYGVYDKSHQIFTSITISMKGLSGTWNERVETITGTISIDQLGSAKTITISVVLLDVSSNCTYCFKDLIFAFSETSLTVSGTYYDPIHGYVVISTVTPLAPSAFANPATSGRLLFTGSNGSQARLTFTTSGETVEADTAGNGDFVIVSASTTVALSNQQKTQLLLGSWAFSYNITSAWTDTLKLDTVFPSIETPGDYAISGTNEYGGIIIGSYISKYDSWAIYDGGTIVSQFYEFQTDGNSVLSGCYYLIPVYTGIISRCYPLTGARDPSIAKQIVGISLADDENTKIGEAQFGTTTSIATVERYNQLKAQPGHK